MDDCETVSCLPLPMRRKKGLQIDFGDPHRPAEAMYGELASGDPSTDSAGTDAYDPGNLRNGEEPDRLIPTSVRSMARDRPSLVRGYALRFARGFGLERRLTTPSRLAAMRSAIHLSTSSSTHA